MGIQIRPITEYFEKSDRKRIINWFAIVMMMILYGGTWLSPWFYHVTEYYNTSITFVILAILFFNNVPWVEGLKNKDWMLYILLLAGIIALINLILIHSHFGCLLILADFLLLWYSAPYIKLTKSQMEALSIFFFVIFFIWFCYDLAFSYNSNTGATVTVFSLLAALVLILRLYESKEIFGLLLVMAMIRSFNLVLWHLARGAFIALVLFLIFYYIVPKKFWTTKKLYVAFCLFATLGSLMFVLSYVSLAKTGYNLQIPFFYKSLFSGREEIWSEVFNLFKQKPMLGIGSGYELESFFEYNMHNAMYDILIVHGVIVFVLSMILIIGRLISFRKHMSTYIQRIAICGVFAMFFESFIDMDVMWSNYSPVLLFLLLCIFAGSEIADEKR